MNKNVFPDQAYARHHHRQLMFDIADVNTNKRLQ